MSKNLYLKEEINSIDLLLEKIKSGYSFCISDEYTTLDKPACIQITGENFIHPKFFHEHKNVIVKENIEFFKSILISNTKSSKHVLLNVQNYFFCNEIVEILMNLNDKIIYLHDINLNEQQEKVFKRGTNKVYINGKLLTNGKIFNFYNVTSLKLLNEIKIKSTVTKQLEYIKLLKKDTVIKIVPSKAFGYDNKYEKATLEDREVLINYEREYYKQVQILLKKLKDEGIKNKIEIKSKNSFILGSYLEEFLSYDNVSIIDIKTNQEIKYSENNELTQLEFFFQISNEMKNIIGIEKYDLKSNKIFLEIFRRNLELFGIKSFKENDFNLLVYINDKKYNLNNTFKTSISGENRFLLEEVKNKEIVFEDEGLNGILSSLDPKIEHFTKNESIKSVEVICCSLLSFLSKIDLEYYKIAYNNYMKIIKTKLYDNYINFINDIEKFLQDNIVSSHLLTVDNRGTQKVIEKK